MTASIYVNGILADTVTPEILWTTAIEAVEWQSGSRVGADHVVYFKDMGVTLFSDKVEAVVDSEGNWTTTIPTDSLGPLDDYLTLTATAEDLAGNGNEGSATQTKVFVDEVVAPIVSKFYSDKPDGHYEVGEGINIYATMSEIVDIGSKITVTLDTGAIVELIALEQGTTLTGFYTITGNDIQSDGLSITSFDFVTDSIKDSLFDFLMTSTELPVGNNLDDNNALVFDANTTINPTIDSVDTKLTDETQTWLSMGREVDIQHGNTLYKVGSGSKWDTGVSSLDRISGDFSTSMTVLRNNSFNSHKSMFGISKDIVDSGVDFSDIGYGIYVYYADARWLIQIWHSGELESGWNGGINDLDVSAGDTLTVRREGNNIIYLVNNEEIYRVGDVLDDDVFYVDTSTKSEYSSIDDIVIEYDGETTVDSSIDVVTHTYNFSEKVGELTASDFSITNGTVTGVYAVNPDRNGFSSTWKVEITPDIDVIGDMILTLEVDTIEDRAGARNLEGDTQVIAIDTRLPLTPTITHITSSTDNGLFREGDDINLSVYVDFNMNSGSTITVTLETGLINQTVLTLTRDTNNAMLYTGIYTVQADDLSTDLNVTNIVAGTGTAAPTNAAGEALITDLPVDRNLNNIRELYIGSFDVQNITIINSNTIELSYTESLFYSDTGRHNADTYEIRIDGELDPRHITDIRMPLDNNFDYVRLTFDGDPVPADAIVYITYEYNIKSPFINIEGRKASAFRGVIGTDNDDILTGMNRDDFIFARGGDDIIKARGGDDIIRAGDGNDIIEGGYGKDTIEGGDGNDTINGGWDNDTLTGGAGKDTFFYTGYYDGNDRIVDFKTGTDIDADVLDFVNLLSFRSGNVLSNFIEIIDDNVNTILNIDRNGNGSGYDDTSITLEGVTGVDLLTMIYDGNLLLVNPNNNDNTWTGGDNNNLFISGGGNDTINGGLGDDAIIGGGGNDIIKGGYGNDTIIGGSGNDTLTGGVGKDTYMYYSTDEGDDTIVGFQTGTDADADVLDLVNLLSYQSGDDLSNFINIIDDNTNTILNIDRNGDGSGYDDASITLEGATGIDLQAMISNGNLVLE